jgi:hypothetical protein
MQPRRRPGIKGRLDALQGDAHNTMSAARGAIEAVKAAALGVMDQLRDGITVWLIWRDDFRFLDFIRGKIKQFPIGVKVDFGDEDE